MSPMTYRLVALTGDDRGREWRLRSGRNVVGRAIGTEVKLADNRSSRTHAAIDVGEEVWVEDLGSRNATFVNGRRIARERIVAGTQITIGETDLLLEEVVGRSGDEEKTVVQTEPYIRKLRDFEVQLLSHGIVGRSPGVMEILDAIARVSRTDATVLITGPTGSGKELIAYAIHYCSLRKEMNFVSLSCAALSETLFESELFGHVEGAFGGAGAERDGVLHYARGGTIFLDEICDLPVGSQAKILRLLDDRTFNRLGSNRTEVADCRFLLATRYDLESAVRRGKFRQDLYYRANAIRVHVPPLSERTEDIELLAALYIEKFCIQYAVAPRELTADALEKLRAYEWPGNVRELQACMERAVLLGESPMITAAEIEVGRAAQR